MKWIARLNLPNLFGYLCNQLYSVVDGVIVVGQYFGGDDANKVVSSIANAGYFNLLVSVFLTVVSLTLAKPLLILFKTPTNILSDAPIYLRLYMLCIIFMTLFYGAFGILRSLSDSKTPFYFLIVSSVLNIVFVYLLKMGVAGATLVSTLAQTIGLIG